MTALDYIAVLARWYVALSLLAAARGKSGGFDAFRRSLSEAFPALGRADAALAFAIVAAEWGIAAALLAGGMSAPLGAVVQYGAICGLALFASFTIVISLSILDGRAIVCTCFGASGRRMDGLDVVRNLVLIAASSVVLLRGPLSLPWPLEAILAGLAVVGVVATVRLRELAWLLRAKAD